jgi:hypothetical protein
VSSGRYINYEGVEREAQSFPSCPRIRHASTGLYGRPSQPKRRRPSHLSLTVDLRRRHSSPVRNPIRVSHRLLGEAIPKLLPRSVDVVVPLATRYRVRGFNHPQNGIKQVNHCCIEGCEKQPRLYEKVCPMHQSRISRYGDPNIVKPKGRPPLKAPTYFAAHMRVYKSKGKARVYDCISCSRQAAEWAYQGGCPDEMVDPRTGSPYSPYPNKYQPMCKRCHIKLDNVKASA